MSLARVQNFSISLDGFGTGEGLSADAYFGHAGDRLHEWMFATRWWRGLDDPGGSGGIDDAFAQLFDPGIGAESLGAGKVGPFAPLCDPGIGAEIRGAGKSAAPGWQEAPEWKGGWGPNPPFHTPV